MAVLALFPDKSIQFLLVIELEIGDVDGDWDAVGEDIDSDDVICFVVRSVVMRITKQSVWQS